MCDALHVLHPKLILRKMKRLAARLSLQWELTAFLRTLAKVFNINWKYSGLAIKNEISLEELEAVNSPHLVKRELIYPLRETENELPQIYPIGSAIDPKFKKFERWHDLPFYEVHLKNCSVFSKRVDLAVITDDGHPIKGLAVSKNTKNGLVAAQRQIRLAKKKHLSGRTLFLSAAMAESNYYHWMIESIPRFAPLINGSHNIEQFDHILMEYSGKTFQKETLQILGIPEEKIIFRKEKQEIFHCEMMVAYTHPACFIPSRWAVDFLNKTFRSRDADPQINRKIFISRKQSRRCLNNEAALEKKLISKGFESFLLEELSVIEQSKLFAEASVIVASHGAGLTNLVHCRPGTAVLEIFQGTHLEIVFWAIARIREMKYRCVFADPSGDLKTDPNAGYVLNLELVDSALSDWAES